MKKDLYKRIENSIDKILDDLVELYIIDEVEARARLFRLVRQHVKTAEDFKVCGQCKGTGGCGAYGVWYDCVDCQGTGIEER